LALAGVLTGRHRRRGPDGFDAASQAVFVLWATALLAVVAAGGHGVTGRVVALGFLATWLHLVAMSCWLGGLVSLALLVERRGVRAAAARFSPIALASVVLLAVTGTTNAWRQADSWSALRDSSYGRWLLVKLIVLVGVVAVAAVSRWLVGYAPPGPASDRAVRRAVTVEAIGMAVVLAATAGLVNSPPPREATLAPVTVSDVEGDRIAQIVLDPPVTGGTTMHVYVTSTAGTLLQPTSITVTAGLPERGIAALELVLSPAGPGHLTADDVVLPIAGTWTFTVAARYSEFDETRFVLQTTVR
jgi:copper transport protein